MVLGHEGVVQGEAARGGAANAELIADRHDRTRERGGFSDRDLAAGAARRGVDFGLSCWGRPGSDRTATELVETRPEHPSKEQVEGAEQAEVDEG